MALPAYLPRQGAEHPDPLLLFDVIAHQRRGAFVAGVRRDRQQFTLLLQQDEYPSNRYAQRPYYVGFFQHWCVPFDIGGFR